VEGFKMKVYKAVGDEFGSYKKVIIDLDNKGLCLVSGPTGAGKSTMFDLVPWTLFGVTAKNGAADDVINWQAESETTGRVTLLAKGKRITIYVSAMTVGNLLEAKTFQTPKS
jgi:DNA repair exonuclease SbcCD ATPase subunit